METEIKAIIEKNLPAQVGEVLKQRLDQAEKDSARVKHLEQLLADKNHIITANEKLLNEYRQNDERNKNLNAREKEIEGRELKFQTDNLAYQLACEKEKTQFTKEVALGLVRNTEYRRNLYDSKSEPYTDQYGQTQYSNKTQNSEEIKKAE